MSKIVLTGFGRLNPCSIGHKKMFDLMVQKKPKGAEVIYYLSHSYDGVGSGKFKQDKCKNPLSYESKIKYVNDMGTDVEIAESAANNIYAVMEDLYKKGYKQVYFFGGEDRVDDFEKMNNYNGKPDKKGNILFTFDKIDIINAGSRDDADDDSSMASASLLRKCVVENDFEKFEHFAGTETLTEQMWKELQYEMGISKMEEKLQRIFRKVLKESLHY